MEKCAECGQKGDVDTIRRCSACNAIRYCSRDCQKRHWSQHKADCRKVRHRSQHEDRSEEGASDPTAADDRKATEEALAEGSDHDASSPLLTCKKCGRHAREMKRCGKCEEVTYCSRDCQRGDWTAHKVTCQTVEVITTEGYRQTEEKEQAGQRATRERERAAAQPRQHDFLSSLLGNAHVTPRLTWDEARSRARRLFPGKEIVDRFQELRNDMLGFMPNAQRSVAVIRIKGVYPHFFRHGRCLEDADGMESFVLFHVNGDPMPYFRYEQLREGNFLCYQNAFIHFFLDGTVGFRIDNASEVHIMEP
ncbi:uncharacterized protein [Littorina saxatilis]|uniref:MYND-type domain-containing protein n=1 Tax=Littorina saxatilis TaxID=31220 RepID=A0AAN9ANT1_9CAEN